MQQLIDGNLREDIQICETKSDPEVQGKLGEICHLLLGHVRRILDAKRSVHKIMLR